MHAAPLLDLACKVFNTRTACVTIVDDRQMFIVEGRGQAQPSYVPDSAWGSGFCCWTTVSSVPSVLLVEDALDDARSDSMVFPAHPWTCRA